MAAELIATESAPRVSLGLRANWPQFSLLVLINAFVGGMVGIERTVVPLIGAEEFRIASTTLVVSFIVSHRPALSINAMCGEVHNRLASPLIDRQHVNHAI
jgi:hypothetical protein